MGTGIVIGIFIGAGLGFMFAALLTAAKRSDECAFCMEHRKV